MTPRRTAKARARRDAIRAEERPAKRATKRATRCTPEVIKSITEFVLTGAPLTLACPAAGIPWITARQWLTPEFYEREPFRTFCDEVDRARAKHGVGIALRLTRAGVRGAWQADLAVAERRFPEEYRPQPAKFAANGGEASLEGLTPGEILDIALAGKGDKT